MVMEYDSLVGHIYIFSFVVDGSLLLLFICVMQKRELVPELAA